MSVDEAIFGADIKNTWEVDVNGDLKTVSGIENAKQRVYNRIMTRLDELIEFYTGYGNESWEIVGETDKEIAASKIKIYTESCLKKEPVVEEILDIQVSFGDEIITVEAEVKFIEQTNSSNLVFGLEAA